MIRTLVSAALAAASLMPLESSAKTTYETAVSAAANEYCSQIASGNNDREGVFFTTMRDNSRLYKRYVRNDPARYERLVRAEIERQCPEAATIVTPGSTCPGITQPDMARIRLGLRVLIIAPGCSFSFN
jgi:hypothetical protein